MHAEPLPISIIKIKNYEKLGKYCVKVKLRRDLNSENLGPYEFRMAFFDNGNLEEFFLFIRNFSMTMEVSGTIFSGTKIQYFLTQVHE